MASSRYWAEEIENIFAPTFPAIHPGLALVVRLRAQSLEVEQDHKFHVDIIGPNDFNVTPGTIIEFKPRTMPGEPDRPVAFTLVMKIVPIVLPEPGTYLGHLYVDSQEVGTFPLDVQKSTIDEASSS